MGPTFVKKIPKHGSNFLENSIKNLVQTKSEYPPPGKKYYLYKLVEIHINRLGQLNVGLQQSLARSSEFRGATFDSQGGGARKFLKKKNFSH